MWIVSPLPGNNHLATPWAMQTNMTKTKPFVFSIVDLLPGPHFGLWPYHLLKLKSQAPCWNLPFPSTSTANDFSRPLDFTSKTTNQFPCPLPCYQVSPVCDLFSHLLPKFLQQTSTRVPACYSTALNRLVQILQVHPQERQQWALFFCSLKYQKAFWEQSRKWHQPPCTISSYLRLREDISQPPHGQEVQGGGWRPVHCGAARLLPWLTPVRRVWEKWTSPEKGGEHATLRCTLSTDLADARASYQSKNLLLPFS